MLVKRAESGVGDIRELQQLLAITGLDPSTIRRIGVEIRNMRAHARAEAEVAYELSFLFGNTDTSGERNWAVLNDLRIEHRGHVTQIDYLVINRLLDVYVIKTKSVHARPSINDHG